MWQVWMALRRVTCDLGNTTFREGLSECCWLSLEKKRLLEDCTWMKEVTCRWSTGHGYQKILKQGASSRSLVSGSACWGRLFLVALLRLCCIQPITDSRAGAPFLGFGSAGPDCCCSHADRLIVVLEKLCREPTPQVSFRAASQKASPQETNKPKPKPTK